MITITLPFPSSDLNPNRKNGKHWGSTHVAKKTARDMGYFVALEAFAKLGKPVIEARRMAILFISPDKRRRDADNLLASSKNYIDGICLAIGIDDSCFDEVVLRRGYRKGAGEMIVSIS